MDDSKTDNSMVEREVAIKYCSYPEAKSSPRPQPTGSTNNFDQSQNQAKSSTEQIPTEATDSSQRQAKSSPRRRTPESATRSNSKPRESLSKSPWAHKPTDMPRNRDGDKKFYALRPYTDLPDQSFISPRRADLKILPGRGGYYDNPNFLHSPKMQHRRQEEERSSNTSNTKWRSQKTTRKRHCIGAAVIFLLVLLVVIAIGISVFFLHNQMVDNGSMPSRPPPSKLDSESLTADPDFEATIRVTSYDWDSRMSDKESDMFRKTASDMEQQLDTIFSKGPIAPLYNYSVVHSLTKGSVVCNFTVHLMKISSDASEEDKQQLEKQKLYLKKTPDIVVQAIKEGIEEIRKAEGQTGVTNSLPVFEVDTAAIQIDPVTTTTPVPSTTTTTTSTTISTTVPTTSTTTSTTVPTTSTTTLTTVPASTTSLTTVPTTTLPTVPTTTIPTSMVSTTVPTTSTTTTAPTTTLTTVLTSTTTSTTDPTTTIPTSTVVPNTVTTSTTVPTTSTTTSTTVQTTNPTTNSTTVPTTTSTTVPTSTTTSTTVPTTTSTTVPTSTITSTTVPTSTTTSTKVPTTTIPTAMVSTTSTTTSNAVSTTTSTTNSTTVPIPTAVVQPTATTAPNTTIDANITKSTTGIPVTSMTSESTTIPSTNSTTQNSTILDITTTQQTPNSSVSTTPSDRESLCPDLAQWNDMINSVCNSSIKAVNEAMSQEDQCFHYSEVVKCTTWLSQVMKYNCSMEAIKLMFNNITTYNCSGTDMNVIEPFPTSNSCEDLNAFKYIIYYECKRNGVEENSSPCSTIFDAPKCVTGKLNELQLNCNPEKVIKLLNERRYDVFNTDEVIACNEYMKPMINGSCYGMSRPEYFQEVPPCFKSLRELKDETTSLNTTCRMYIEGTRCLERKADNRDNCSSSHISQILTSQMEYVKSVGEYGITALLYIFGSPEKIGRVSECREQMDDVENMANICDDDEFISDTIFSNLCIYQTKQDEEQCSITTSDLVQCTIRTVQQLDSNCTDTRIEQAITNEINDTTRNSTVCDNAGYCSRVLIKNEEILLCLNFLKFINYTSLTIDDVCQFYGEGLECMSYFLKYKGVSCQPDTLIDNTADFLLHNKHTEFDFTVCKDNLTLETIPSTRPLCDNNESLLKYTTHTCIKPILDETPNIPDPPCSLLTSISYCVVKTLYESIIYCTPEDVAMIVLNNTDFVQDRYLNLNFTSCSVPDFNATMATPTPATKLNVTCDWNDITEIIPQACQAEIMAVNKTRYNGKCEMLSKLVECTHSSLESRGMICPIALIQEILVDHVDDVTAYMGINPQTCTDIEPVKKDCSSVNQIVKDPNSPEYVLKCFSFVFVSLSGDISYDDACRLLAMSMRCAMKKSKTLGYNCTTDTIEPAVKSYTSLVFRSYMFDPDNCTAPIETRSICEAGDLMTIVAASAPCTYYANLNNKPTCQSLSMLVECVAMRISTSGMFCSKSLILEQLIENIDLFKLSSTFNFTSCSNQDVEEIPSTNLRSCPVVSAAESSPLDICQTSIKEFQQAVNDSTKCRVLFDVMGCTATTLYHMGYNCTISDIIGLYGPSVVQDFNPANCDRLPTEDDIPMTASLCTNGAVLNYFINYDCKAYIPKHQMEFCGSLAKMTHCLSEILNSCGTHEIEKMIQVQPFMMYIGSLEDCKDEMTTTPAPNYLSTTPHGGSNSSYTCVWENVLETASQNCPDQMTELSQNSSDKCPHLSSLAQCIHITMVSRDIGCTLDDLLELSYQNGVYMRQTFNVEIQECLDDNQLLHPPVYTVNRGSLCRSKVVYDYISEVSCIDSVKDCNLLQYTGCLSADIMRLTNSQCSMENFSQNFALDTNLQTYFYKCSNETGLLDNECIKQLAMTDTASVSVCFSPIIIMQDTVSCSLYAQSLKCMSRKLGKNCTIPSLHKYIHTVYSTVDQLSGNMTMMSVIPRVAKQCNDFVSNLTVDDIPDICEEGHQMLDLIKQIPCIPPTDNTISSLCFYMVPALQQCVQLASNMTGCKNDDIVERITTNTTFLKELLPNVDVNKCLANGTFQEFCPVILPSNRYNVNIESCVTLGITYLASPYPVSAEDICRINSVVVKCVKEKGRLDGYDCTTKSILPLIDSLPVYLNMSAPSCKVDEIEGSICDESDIMVIMATSQQCSMTYYNIEKKSHCSILDTMSTCVSRRFEMSGMYCSNNKIREGLVSQTDRLQIFSNKMGISALNFSSCLSDDKEVTYGPANLTECSEQLKSGYNPVSMCGHVLMALNQTEDMEQQCQVFEDLLKCLVYISHFNGYKCTNDDIEDLYIKNNSMLSSSYDTLSQSCSGSLNISSPSTSNPCNFPFIYDYITKYICSQYLPRNSHRTHCGAVQDLSSCIKMALSYNFQTMCPNYLIEGHLQLQPFMTYIGSISKCRNESSGQQYIACEGVSVNKWYFTDCNQHYTMINQEPDKSCLHWESTIHCVQTNVYNDGKYRYCKTKDVLDSLISGVELGKILPNFDPESCTKEMYETLPEDPCDEMMLYQLAMNKCDPKNKICGQEADIQECVKNDLMSHGQSCKSKIDEKLRNLISMDNRECREGQYTIGDRSLVYIYQGQIELICGLDWDNNDARVLCNQLGYSFGIGEKDYSSKEHLTFSYNCTGDESRLEDCPRYLNQECGFTNTLAKAVCYNDDTQYGLIDGPSANAGRVTVERNGVKGYLCSGYYGNSEIDSVCRKLGYAGGDDLSDDKLLKMSLDKTWKNTISCSISGGDFASCVRKPWDVVPLSEDAYNSCYKSMAVYCYKKTRLNTSYKNNTGMLMTYVEGVGNSQLSLVCKDNINQDLVTAQCQYLGFNKSGELLDVNPFVSSLSYFGVKVNSCPSTANSIEDCEVEFSQMCSPGPAILHCFINKSAHNDGDMKIDESGRIWVYKYDLWGTICSKGWDDKAAMSFCRSQGFDSAVSRELNQLSYNAIDTKWLYNVSCQGNETGLLNCDYATSDVNEECSYANDAGAYCYNQSNEPKLTIRDGVPPTDGSLPHYGRVYFNVNGEEGALCSPRSEYLPQVICKQQGFDYGEYFESDLPPRTTSISWRGDLFCKRDDKLVSMCFEEEKRWIKVDSSSPYEIACDGHNTVQVYCYREAWLSTGFLNKTGMVTILDKSEEPIILCENQINREGLDVFCKFNGKSNTAQKLHSIQYPGYHAENSIGYNCSGEELSLSTCQVDNNVRCDGRPVVVRCDDDPVSDTITDLKMEEDGRLMLQKYSIYGSMCAEQWTDVEADVFCKSKGYIKGYAKILNAHSRVAQFHAFKCNGSENSLLDCDYLNDPDKSCDDAAVNCETEADSFTISLEHQGKYEAYGKVLVSKSGMTSYLCDAGYFSSADAGYICRHLGFDKSEVLNADREEQTSAWKVDFECKSNTASLFGCINGKWTYETWKTTDYNPSICRYEAPQIKCSEPVNDSSVSDLKARCENSTIYELVDKDCDDVIDNITVEVKTSQMSACKYFPQLVQCLAEKLISRHIYCTELQVYSALRQNIPEITSNIGGLNTDYCDGMAFRPKTDCASLPLFSKLLPQCYMAPDTMVTDMEQIAKLCSKGVELFECMAKKTQEVSYQCRADDFMILMSDNQQFMTEQLMFNVTYCIQQPPQLTTQSTVTNTVSTDVKTRCLNSSIYELVDKDCDDVIDNITMEVKTSQMSACQYFPELVRCLSEKLINRNILCTENQVYSTLRQNQPEITSIIGGLNTDSCDGMTFVPKDACTSLPLFTKLLPQCYDVPDTMITDPEQIIKLCSKGVELFECIAKKTQEVSYQCRAQDFMILMSDNQQFMTEQLMFNVTYCIQQPPQQTTQSTVTTNVSSDVNTRCLNSSIYELVDKDCDDIIDNITMEVKTSQMSACQYFPQLVRCLSEKLINRNILCTENQVYSTLRQNQPEITSIIGGLNTDSCDGMTFVSKDACTSLPLFTKLLPQCYDVPDTMITDPEQIAKLCMKDSAICILNSIENLGYTGCTVDVIEMTYLQNPQWVQKELKFDINQCQQEPK